MTKQDGLNKLSALGVVMDKLLEDMHVISAAIDSDGVYIHLRLPDEGDVMEAFDGCDIMEGQYGLNSVKRYICVCGVEVFWLLPREAYDEETP